MFFLIQFVRNFLGVAGEESKSRINSPNRDKRLLDPFHTTQMALQINRNSIACRRAPMERQVGDGKLGWQVRGNSGTELNLGRTLNAEVQKFACVPELMNYFLGFGLAA